MVSIPKCQAQKGARRLGGGIVHSSCRKLDLVVGGCDVSYSLFVSLSCLQARWNCESLNFGSRALSTSNIISLWFWAKSEGGCSCFQAQLITIGYRVMS